MSAKKHRYGIADFEKKYGPLSLGRFISSCRLSEELSQKEFAKKLGISAANLLIILLLLLRVRILILIQSLVSEPSTAKPKLANALAECTADRRTI